MSDIETTTEEPVEAAEPVEGAAANAAETGFPVPRRRKAPRQMRRRPRRPGKQKPRRPPR